MTLLKSPLELMLTLETLMNVDLCLTLIIKINYQNIEQLLRMPPAPPAPPAPP